ncbi:hypothetical protein DL98DRAFT_597591 [Cadophora sp. DSE1049]|nr:hypothetical protein DL98DRAFT_597591 [Cadophora sp. DSE1049]
MAPKVRQIYRSPGPSINTQMKGVFFDSVDTSEMTIFLSVIGNATSSPQIIRSKPMSYSFGTRTFFFWRQALGWYLGEQSAWYQKARDLVYLIQIIEIDGQEHRPGYFEIMTMPEGHGWMDEEEEMSLRCLMAWYTFNNEFPWFKVNHGALNRAELSMRGPAAQADLKSAVTYWLIPKETEKSEADKMQVGRGEQTTPEESTLEPGADMRSNAWINKTGGS